MQLTAIGSLANVIVVKHAPWLVVLSIIVSVVGAYAAVELMDRLRHAGDGAYTLWLLGAATVDGLGIWSMHYTAKLALQLPRPLYLDWRRVILSLLVGIAGSALALLLARRKRLSWPRAIAAGILLGGIGISGLHYTAMGAVIDPHTHHYHSPLLVVSSILAAVIIATVSLPLTFRISATAGGKRMLRATASAIVRGMANPAMHYTAMAAVAFASPSADARPPHGVSIASIGIIGITLAPVSVVVVGLLTSLLDRIRKERAVLDCLFEQTPEAVAVTMADGRVTRVNREFTRLFGYTSEDAEGRPLEELIGDGETAAVRDAGKRSVVEGLRRTKDGRAVHIAGVVVPVQMPGGTTEHYFLLRDVTEQKRAEDALRTYPRRLIETQEAERQRFARELHDEIGQMLTGIGMALDVTGARRERSEATVAEARGLVHELTQRVRNLALDLRPAMLDDFGLARALEVLLERYERQTGIRIDFLHEGIDRRFRPDVELTAYRIVQEALTNVARHARASAAAVTINAGSRELLIEIEDHGAGFDAELPAELTVGLASMRERAAAAGGTVTVTSSPGGGTTVTARLPLNAGGAAG